MRGLFVAEGTSDGPLAEIVQGLFVPHECDVQLTPVDFERLTERVSQDIDSKVRAGLTLMGSVDLVVIHRDADNAGWEARRQEIITAVAELSCGVVPVIPVRMTEAWLLLDEQAIRTVAGNPKGTTQLELPSAGELERRADPKAILAEALLIAADESGRRRERVKRRFNQHRRQLLERLDPNGPVVQLPSWQRLLDEVARVAAVAPSRQR